MASVTGSGVPREPLSALTPLPPPRKKFTDSLAQTRSPPVLTTVKMENS